MFRDAVCLLGLSPRVRGNRDHERHKIQRYRSIPACAGEPIVMGFRWTIRTVYPRVCGGTLAFRF